MIRCVGMAAVVEFGVQRGAPGEQRERQHERGGDRRDEAAERADAVGGGWRDGHEEGDGRDYARVVKRGRAPPLFPGGRGDEQADIEKPPATLVEFDAAEEIAADLGRGEDPGGNL